jgi:hypothetical protein
MTHKLNRRAVAVAAIALLMAATTAGAFQSFERVSRVEAFETDIWTVWVSQGATHVEVNGDDDTDLDCYVYDKRSGQLLDKDVDSTDFCIMDFTKHSRGNIEIRIENLGNVWNRYRLTVD